MSGKTISTARRMRYSFLVQMVHFFTFDTIVTIEKKYRGGMKEHLDRYLYGINYEWISYNPLIDRLTFSAILASKLSILATKPRAQNKTPARTSVERTDVPHSGRASSSHVTLNQLKNYHISFYI